MKRYCLALLVFGIALCACRKDREVRVDTTQFTVVNEKPCGQVLTGTLAGVILTPGVYCFDAEAELTGLLTLNGAGDYVFKVGTTGTGALTMTSFDMLLTNNAAPCAVTWRITDDMTTTDSNIVGTYLAGKDVTLTRGTLTGRVWSKTSTVTITQTIVSNCP